MRFLLRLTLALVCFSFACTVVEGQTGPEQIDVRPYAPMHGSSFEQVGLMNGSLTMNIPVWSFHQRGKLKLDFTLEYNSPTFELTVQCQGTDGGGFPSVATQKAVPTNGGGQASPNEVQPPTCNPQAPCITAPQQFCAGWYDLASEPAASVLGQSEGVRLAASTDYAVLLVDHTAGNGSQELSWNFRTPDMGIHDLQETTTGQFRTFDGTGWLYDPANCILTDSEGTRYVFVCTPGAPNTPIQLVGGHNPGVLSYMEDTSGNRITVTYGPTSKTWTDTENRTISEPVKSSVMDSRCPVGSTGSNSFQIPGVANPVILCSGMMTYATHLFGLVWTRDGYGEAQGSLPTISGMILPSGDKWGFTYTPQPGDANYGTAYSYGELTRIDLPTGARSNTTGGVQQIFAAIQMSAVNL